jgi:hypothetical protein
MSHTSGIGTLNVTGNFSPRAVKLQAVLQEPGTLSLTAHIMVQQECKLTPGGLIYSSTRINFTVNNGAYLQMGTGATVSYITSGGTFTLASGGPRDHLFKWHLCGRYRIRQYTDHRQAIIPANYIYNGAVNQAVGSGYKLL